MMSSNRKPILYQTTIKINVAHCTNTLHLCTWRVWEFSHASSFVFIMFSTCSCPNLFVIAFLNSHANYDRNDGVIMFIYICACMVCMCEIGKERYTVSLLTFMLTRVWHFWSTNKIEQFNIRKRSIYGKNRTKTESEVQMQRNKKRFVIVYFTTDTHTHTHAECVYACVCMCILKSYVHFILKFFAFDCCCCCCCCWSVNVG